ncbi:TraR/DksA family transcriptional regulator [Patescibacteria group bacterium]|nr:TraR/DksA family transcriptional regulator [Patescibacteria group bacterium]
MAVKKNAAKKQSFSKEFLEKMKEQLLVQKSKLEKDLAKFTQKNPHVADDFDSKFPEYGDKEDENAAEVADYAARIPLEQNLEKTLRDINQSLERLKKKTYGICKYCKKAIEEKRLKARPTSSACVECKKAITQEI